VSEYGILGLINTTIFIAVAIGKFGFPNSIVRFYQDFRSQKSLSSFYSTMVFSSAGIAAIIATLFGVVTHFIPTRFIGVDTVGLLYLVPVLIFIGCTNDIFTSFLRAEQKTKLYNLISVIHRYGSLSLCIFIVFFFVKGLYGFYIGQVISGIMVLTFLIYYFSKRWRISAKSFSKVILGDSIKFGLPLVWAELGHLVLNYADRYLVQLFLGSISLGLYTAGYNLATYVAEVIIYPINYAMTPVYMDILVNKGEEETKVFFTKLFRYFILILSPVVFGFIAVSRDLLMVLASSKYMEAYTILPYVVIGQSIYACSIILNSGLFIRKKTHLLTVIMIGVCFLNVGINIILIPLFGILGAAQATLISYICYTLIITYYAFKEFRFRIEYGRILLYLALGATMYLVINMINGKSPLDNLIMKIPAGAFIYFILVLILDRDVRSTLAKMIWKSNKLKHKFMLQNK
jgi:O-antigen/teichoic acid export membrane protein